MSILEILITLAAFGMASYSVIGNDVIQTLGTFLTSNARKSWWILWLYASSILVAVIVYGWATHGGDVSYGRLSNIPLPASPAWWYVLPPLALLVLTRFGLPVSTTFVILSVFSAKDVIGSMVMKSVGGYILCFLIAFCFYIFTAIKLESDPDYANDDDDKKRHFWMGAQWVSTGLLWSQWLIQDFANIYVYLPRQLTALELAGSVVVILLLMAYLFKDKGGKIQGIVTSKTNTANIRSATIIDFVYAISLSFFTYVNTIPMSTTWAFVGVLAGREMAIRWRINRGTMKHAGGLVLKDLLKVNIGLIVSVVLAFLIKSFQ